MVDNSRGGIIYVNGQPFMASMHREGELVRLSISVSLLSPIHSIEATLPLCNHCAESDERLRAVEACSGCNRAIVEVKL